MASGQMCSFSWTALSVTDTGDFVQLRSVAAVRIVIHGIWVHQTSDTTLAMNGIHLKRGTGGAVGSAGTEDKFNVGNPTILGTTFTLPTTDVATGVDLNQRYGWNILQEFIWLPTPQFRLELAASDELGISLVNTDSLTIGGTIIWEEFAN